MPETNSSVIWSAFHIARAPMYCCLATAASIRAMSRRSPSTDTSSIGREQVTELGSTAPVASTPAASPAMVPSTRIGNTLLVPVETGTSGTDSCADATARLVPSPPRVTMQAAPLSVIALAARIESRSRPTIGTSRLSNSIAPACSEAAALARPAESGMAITLPTPAANSPASMRSTIFTFSSSGTNRPLATSRLMSLPAAGFTIRPTVGTGPFIRWGARASG